MDLLSLVTDVRIASTFVVGTLGLTFLHYSTALSRPYARWFSAAALVFAGSGLVARVGELATLVPPAVAAPVGSIAGLVSLAAVVTGLHLHRSGSRARAWPVFWACLLVPVALALPVLALLPGRPFVGPTVVALCLTAVAGFLVRRWHEQRWNGFLLLAAALLLHPLLLAVSVNAGLEVAQFRQITPLPLMVAFVLLFTLVLQHDAQVLDQELQDRQRAEAELKVMADTLEAQVECRTAQLQELVQGLRSFTGMVPHDLRGPLGNVASLAGLAARAAGQGDIAEVDRWLGLIRAESLRAVDMVGDLLTLARVDQGPPPCEPVDMQQLVEDCVTALQPQFAQAAHAVHALALPRVTGHAALLRHVVGNLLANALKFGQARGPALRIEVAAQRQGDFWRFSVRDNGAGFDPACAAQLFKPFSRLAPSDVPGTGLGLTVVLRVVELHGGQAGASSLPGQGAEFWWTLPVDSDARGSRDVGAKPAAAGTRSASVG